MKYVLESISTVQACDALLAGAKRKKQNLERRARNLGELLVTFRKRINEVHAESAEVLSSLEIFTGDYESLSEGIDKVNLKIRIKRLELQQAMLEKKAMTYNVGALLVKEMQYNRLDSQVAALEEYVAAVVQRREVLEVPTLRIIQRKAGQAERTSAVRILYRPLPVRAGYLSIHRTPIFLGAHAHHLFKDPAKMLGIFEAEAISNFAN